MISPTLVLTPAKFLPSLMQLGGDRGTVRVKLLAQEWYNTFLPAQRFYIPTTQSGSKFTNHEVSEHKRVTAPPHIYAD